ncbi:MAG TPA: adenosine deaminase [Ignavibacteria bacterium]
MEERIINEMPKVLLHDHLDGGLRPETIVELAKDIKYDKLPSNNPDDLRKWFFDNANSGSLPLYLRGFDHTIALMQTPEALERVAYEMMEDMKKENIVYVETRFAPVFHINDKLHYNEVVSSVLKGLEKGKKDFGIEYGLILCAMRNMQISQEIAELAVDFREKGVVGFDLAGEEGGYPPKKHVDAFHYIQRENFNITIHAGEAFGKESIWQAIQWCGAHRIGHATRLIEDIAISDNKVVKLGTLAQYILDKRIPLEVCLSSNLHTGVIKDIKEHPFGLLFKEKFRLTINTDNRLMSNTTLSNEFKLASLAFNLTFEDLEKLTINAMKSAFIDYQRRINVIYNIIKPGFNHLRLKYNI